MNFPAIPRFLQFANFLTCLSIPTEKKDQKTMHRVVVVAVKRYVGGALRAKVFLANVAENPGALADHDVPGTLGANPEQGKKEDNVRFKRVSGHLSEKTRRKSRSVMRQVEVEQCGLRQGDGRPPYQGHLGRSERARVKTKGGRAVASKELRSFVLTGSRMEEEEEEEEEETKNISSRLLFVESAKARAVTM